MDTRRSASFTGRGRKRKTLARLKIAVLAPMPSASVRMAMKVKPGLLRNMRRLKRMSCQRDCMVAPRAIESGTGSDPGNETLGIKTKVGTFKFPEISTMSSEISMEVRDVRARKIGSELTKTWARETRA